MNQLLLEATFQTVFMVTLSSLIGVLIGIPLGVFLFTTARFGLFENIWLNRILGFIVNAIRSTPYIILMIALIPLTRLLMGSAIGTVASTVPLSIAAVMLYCRIVEENLRGVPSGLIEAAQAMGASPTQIITKVLLPESLPGLVSGLTFVIISIIGFSAMAGALGGGGLGDFGITYGHQRHNLTVMFQVIVILILMVQAVQWTGDRTSKRLRK